MHIYITIKVGIPVTFIRWMPQIPYSSHKQHTGPGKTFATVIAASPELKEVFIDVKKDIETGKLTSEDLRDIIAFAHYTIK
jgi:hypothetical protein